LVFQICTYCTLIRVICPITHSFSIALLLYYSTAHMDGVIS
jgi:hypothetical protein